MYTGYTESDDKVKERWEQWCKTAAEFDEQRRILSNITEEAQELYFGQTPCTVNSWVDENGDLKIEVYASQEPATVTDAVKLAYGAHELTPAEIEGEAKIQDWNDWQQQVTELRGGL